MGSMIRIAPFCMALFFVTGPLFPQTSSSPPPRALALKKELERMMPYGPDHLGYLAFAAEYLKKHYDLSPDGAERFGRRFRERDEDMDPFALLSGGLAIRESLQLDRMTNSDSGEETVPLSSLEGPTIAAHPFKEMLGSKKVEIPEMARFAPADFYFLHISQPAGASDLLRRLSQTTGSALRRFWPSGVDFQTREKLIMQLALKIDPSNEKYYGLIFQEIGVVGSDPFIGNGADITIIFRLKRKDLFLSQVKTYRTEFQKQGAVPSSATLAGLPVELISTRDRRVHSLLVQLTEDTIAISNSEESLSRVIRVSRGEAPSLASADEFRFMRSVYPWDAQETAFLYLSDPFIRRLTGPEVRIKEARRVVESIRMANLERFCILYFHLYGKRANNVAELKTAFGGDLPDTTGLELSPDSFAVRSARGQIGLMQPNIDTKVETVTAREAESYRSFLNNYNTYWRKYFDPIGIRITSGNRIKLETCILPLIEHSFYADFKEITGDQSIPLLAGDRALAQEISSGSVRIRTEKMNELLDRGSQHYMEAAHIKLNEIFGEELQIHVLDARPLVDFDAGILLQEILRRRNFSEKPFIGFLIWSLFHPIRVAVPLKSPGIEQKAMDLVTTLTAAETGSDRSIRVDAYDQTAEGKTFRVLLISIEDVIKIRLYMGVSNGSLHITTTQEHLLLVLNGGLDKSIPRRIIDFFRTPQTAPEGQAMAVLRPSRLHLERSLALSNAGETAKDAAFRNISTFLLFHNLFGDRIEDSDRSFGFRLDPDILVRMENGAPVTDFGSPADPRINQDTGKTWQKHLATEEIRLGLEFTKEGLKSVIEIQP